jgi:hypothetical protein
MNELWAALRNPRVSTTGALLAVLSGGFVLLGLGYRSSAAIGLVPFQMSYVVSGGVVGLAVIGTALVLLSVHVDRVEAAEERRLLAELQRRVLDVQQARTRRAVTDE